MVSASASAKNLLKICLIFLALSSPHARAQDACPSDMEEVRVGRAISCIPEPRNVSEARKELSTDPRFSAFLSGKWDFIHPANARPGEHCGAIFQKQDAMIWLMGPGDEYRGAMLRFYGPNIPKPSRTDQNGTGKQKITLTQAPDPPQTLTVISSAYKQFDFGVLSIPVPSLDAMIGAMTDSQSFKIEIDGKVVFNSTWNGGLRARDALKKCARAK